MNEQLTAYLAAFVDELARSGVRHVVVSPGSRSTPLALLGAEHPGMKLWMNIDERSAGFFALGMAKALRSPVALLCTSGTAAANYMPAVTEAYFSRVPLIVLTADRPHELRDVGAPQTINQVGLYGSHVKWFMDMPLPESSDKMIRQSRTVAARAAAIATSKPSGPIHLNFPLREPLVPNLGQPWPHTPETHPTIQIREGAQRPDRDQLDPLLNLLENVSRGIIICGPIDEPGFPEAVVKLAELLQFPILADPLSQLRSGKHRKHLIVDKYDVFLRNQQVVKNLHPEVIIRFGAMPVSKSLMLYTEQFPDCRYVVIDETNGWREPALLASDMIYAQPKLFCETLCEIYESQPAERNKTAESAWCQQWLTYNECSDSVIQQCFATESFFEEQLFEGQLFNELIDLLPEQSALFVGNSMPIRDLDAFFSNNNQSIRIAGNRGVNGIDGLISTALGFSTSCDHVFLVLGDLSFYHDMNGLLAAKLHQLKLTVIIVNNDGGGIFSFLPQADVPQHFEALFGTPTGLNFEHAARLYEGEFTRVTSWEHFRQTMSKANSADGLHIIEVRTDREHNVSLHQKVWKQVFESIEQLPPFSDGGHPHED